jgi:signal transducing adaptor molecule
MSTWADEFRNSPDLGIMGTAYQKLRMQQPGLVAPSKPVKREISSDDRRSIKDKGVASPAAGGTVSNVPEQQQQQQQQQPSQAQPAAPQGTTAATVSRVRALYDFTPSEPGELAFRKNDIIAVLESVFKDWWKGSLRGQTGIFPLNYVEKLQDPTKDELERDAQMESEVFGEIKNVEKLLALLSVGGEAGGRRGEREEEEISELYQRTLSIRPKLIELIARYSQKKGEMVMQCLQFTVQANSCFR